MKLIFNVRINVINVYINAIKYARYNGSFFLNQDKINHINVIVFLWIYKTYEWREIQLLRLVASVIAKKYTNMRRAILRFLSSGDSQQSLWFSFRIGKATVNLMAVCDANYCFTLIRYREIWEQQWQWYSSVFFDGVNVCSWWNESS